MTNPAGGKTVTLSAPVEHNGTIYSVLTFREATVGDLMAIGSFKDETSKTFALMAAVSDVPIQAFKKIKVSDVSRIMNEVGDLMGNEMAATTGE